MSDDKKTLVFHADAAAKALWDEQETRAKLMAEGKLPKPIAYSILDQLEKSQIDFPTTEDGQKQFRLAFESDPTRKDIYHGVYADRPYLLPYALIKRIHRTDDLIATILNIRGNHLSQFGRPRASRFDSGFDIVMDRKYMAKLSPEDKAKWLDRIEKAKKLLATCGHDDGWTDAKKLTLPQCLKMITQDGLRFGRCAIEIVYNKDNSDEFHSFRPADAGTIFRLAPNADDNAKRLREASKKMLEELEGKELPPDEFEMKLKDALADFEKGGFAWVQVLDNRPFQSFYAKQMIVHNFFPITDIEYNGYPLTPLDTIINAVTTHINITQHNKLYFQSGRATRGMLVIKSDSIDPGTIENIKIQFNASINSVQNAWRMPVFGIQPTEDVQWQPLDATGSRDGEFQLLSDANARVILAAFQLSPDEVPGYGHLSRASNQQTMSESQNEYKLEAARDVGLRPLLLTIQDLFNSRILPLIDKELAEHASIIFAGLDATDPIKELDRLQRELTIHATYNSILEAVDKSPIDKGLGGDVPLNPAFQAVIEKYMTVGQILEAFMGVKGAAQDQQYAYVRDPFWFQWQQLIQAQQQMEMQQEMLKQQQAAGGAPGGPGGPGGPEGGDPSGGPPPQDGGGEGAPPAEGEEGAEGEGSPDLTNSIEQLAGLLNKTEAQLPTSRKRLLAQQRSAAASILAQWEKDSEELLRNVLEEAKKHSSNKGE